MKVASNRIKDVLDFFHDQLDNLYGSGETDAIAKSVFEYYLNIKRSEFPVKLNENINQSDLIKVYDAAKELATGKPLQYILKEAWFYNLKFKVNEHVLIPRPETEELVDLIVKENGNASSFLDVGTGSGCIPVSIKSVNQKANVSACDISKDALKIASENATVNKTEVHFVETDILNSNETERNIISSFDVIVSNPPYIKISEKESMHKNVKDFEPHLALFVNGNDDIIFYKKIIDLCDQKLNREGRLYFELNPLTSDHVKEYAEASGIFKSVELIKDLSQSVRFLKAVKK